MGTMGKRIMRKAKKQNPPKCYNTGEYEIGCDLCEWNVDYKGGTPWWVKEKGQCFPRY